MITKNYREVKKTIKAYARFQSLFKQDPEIPVKVENSLKCMDMYSWKMGNKKWSYVFFVTNNRSARVFHNDGEYELIFV